MQFSAVTPSDTWKNKLYNSCSWRTHTAQVAVSKIKEKQMKITPINTELNCTISEGDEINMNDERRYRSAISKASLFHSVTVSPTRAKTSMNNNNEFKFYKKSLENYHAENKIHPKVVAPTIGKVGTGTKKSNRYEEKDVRFQHWTIGFGNLNIK